MDSSLMALGTALWLGILTSISPCPLATNITAISFIGQRVGKPRRVLASGLLYTLGRAVTYAIIGGLVVSSLLSTPTISHFLQREMNRVLGPVLILVGMALLRLLPLPGTGIGVGGKLRERAGNWGVGGAGVLGILFALSFCPVSAALFFGSLIPLALQVRSGILLPVLYGVGTGLPVLLFAGVLAYGSGSLARVFDKVSTVERWARRITGVLFIGVGVYFTLVHVFRVIN